MSWNMDRIHMFVHFLFFHHEHGIFSPFTTNGIFLPWTLHHLYRFSIFFYTNFLHKLAQ
jgi:hypothetical protein